MLYFHIQSFFLFSIFIRASIVTSQGTSIAVVAQTSLITDAVQTTYLAYSQTGNSQVLETIQGTPTILPLWYCDPTLSASVCSSCPTSTTSGQEPCPTNFNYILIMPLVAVVGGIVPPPPDLPTLSIGSDGIQTPEPTPTPTQITTAPPGETTEMSSDTSISVSAPCTVPSILGASFATAMPATPPAWIPPKGSPAPVPTANQLPVLQLVNADPAHPTIWSACGPYSNDAYYSGGFFQDGSSFSRDEGLDAVGKFCNDMIAASVVVGPPSVTATAPGLSTKSPLPLVVRTYDKDSDGKNGVMLRIQTDVDNKSEQQTGLACPQNWMYDVRNGGFAKCRQYFGQVRTLSIFLPERESLTSVLRV